MVLKRRAETWQDKIRLNRGDLRGVLYEVSETAHVGSNPNPCLDDLAAAIPTVIVGLN